MNKTQNKLQKIVVKIGTNILTTESGQLHLNRLRSLVSQISDIKQKTRADIILVTSGSITCGSQKLGLKTETIPQKQAAASVGQILLMNQYMAFFGQASIPVGQILLTKDSFKDETKSTNVKNTIRTLWNEGAIPIVNENDCVTTDEIDENFDDNDDLSSRVSILIDADLYIILTDTDGVFTKNPKIHDDAKLLTHISSFTEENLPIIEDSSNGRSRGGMESKIRAAKRAFDHDVPVIIANGAADNVLLDILNGTSVGTKISKH